MGEIVLNLEVAARKKQVDWVFSLFFPSQRASGGRVGQGGKALGSPITQGMEMKVFGFKLKSSSFDVGLLKFVEF